MPGKATEQGAARKQDYPPDWTWQDRLLDVGIMACTLFLFYLALLWACSLEPWVWYPHGKGAEAPWERQLRIRHEGTGTSYKPWPPSPAP
jgi:hypothetical protein